MENLGKKIGLTAAGLLLAGAAAYAGNNSKDVNQGFWTADGIAVTPIVNEFSGDVDLLKVISGGENSHLYVIDAETAIKGKLNWLNSQRAKDYYNSQANPETKTIAQEARLRMISKYESLLAQVQAEKKTPAYYQSEKNLEGYLSDHILTEKEQEELAPGFVYTVGRGVNGDWDAIMFFTPSYEKPEVPSATAENTKKQELSKSQIEGIVKSTIDQYRQRQEEKKKAEKEEMSHNYKPKENLESKTRDPEAGLGIVAGAGAGIPGSYDFNLGLKYGRFALLLEGGSRPNLSVKDVNSPLLNNSGFTGTETLEDFFNLGATLVYYQPLNKNISAVVKIGGGKEWYQRKDHTAIIAPDGSELNPNDSSYSESNFYVKLAAGPKIKLSDILAINPNLGYRGNFNNLNQFYGNLDVIVTIPGTK